MNILCVREHTIENGKAQVKTIATFDLDVIKSVHAEVIGDNIASLCIQTIDDIVYYNDSEKACYDVTFS